ncbi:MAG: hypothetical protein U5P10_17025 [Spirochaetia bacterium]|nr:hypothetical protein [Spirochaetia bacterium]
MTEIFIREVFIKIPDYRSYSRAARRALQEFTLLLGHRYRG